MAAHPIYQIYSELQGFSPLIWRRFQVQNNVTMARLAYIIMTMYEMQANHMFCFDVLSTDNFFRYMENKLTLEEFEKLCDIEVKAFKNEKLQRYEIINEERLDYVDESVQLHDATKCRIKDVIIYPQSEMSFTYDFGDGWEIMLILEEIFEDRELPGKELPRALEGRGYGIVEDCGGVLGLTDLVEAFHQERGDDYEMYRDWLGVDSFDISRFDINDINFRLKKVPRIYGDIYEKRWAPSQQSLNLLQRKYLNNRA